MLVVKNLPANAGGIRDVGSIPGLGRSPGVGNGNPLQYSNLENSIYTVHGVAKSRTRLKCLNTSTDNKSGRSTEYYNFLFGFCGCLVAKSVLLFVTLWTVAHQAPQSMGFPRPEYWNVFPFPSPGDLLGLGIKAISPALAGRFFTTEPLEEPKHF